MTPTELHEAHRKLGLSAAKAARFFRVSDGKTVRRWWSGESSIPGPVAVLTDALIRSKPVRDSLGLELDE